MERGRWRRRAGGRAPAARAAESAVAVLGTGGGRGAYLLHIRLRRCVEIRYRRWASPARFPRGAYVYVGSAMGSGASGLCARLLRHATRSHGPPQPVLPALLGALAAVCRGARVQPPARKTLHWHIDHLLEAADARLVAVTAVQADRPLEAWLAGLLAADPAARLPAPGFGASDAPGSTHLFQVPGGAAWRRRCRLDIAAMVASGPGGADRAASAARRQPAPGRRRLTGATGERAYLWAGPRWTACPRGWPWSCAAPP